MIARFRSVDTWAHVAQLDAQQWDLPLYSAANKAGSIQVTGEHPELAMTWAGVNGRLYYVDNATPGNGTTKLSLRLPINAFSRAISFSPLSGSLESYIAGTLTSAFINQGDAAYAMPYLSVTASGSTNVTLAYNAGEVIDFLDILRLAEEKGIEITFSPEAAGLSVSIHPRITAAHNLVLGDGHSQLNSYTRSYTTTAKVTVRRVTVEEDESITVNSSENWYLHPDGTVSTTPPSPRIRGKWAVVSVEDDDIPSSAAALEVMGSNSNSYKLTFYSDTVFNYGDRITARFQGMLQTGEITACSVSQNDPRYLYEIGTMPTTLTEKLAPQDQTGEQSTTIEGGTPSYLSRTGGSVGGSLRVTQALKAGKLILSSDSYGTSLPSTGVEGQVFFLLT